MPSGKKSIKCLGIIPARGGSKTVTKKNIRPLVGMPLIAYTIKAAQQSKFIERLCVSTDSPEIANVAKSYQAPVPFFRPDDLAQDNTPDRPVLVHATKWFIENENLHPECVALLRPTTPFKTAELIDRAVEKLFSTGADSVRSVTEVEGIHHPYWMYKKDDQDRAQPVIDGVKLEKYYQRQLLPPIFRLNGVIDVIRTSVLLENQTLYGQDMRLMEIPEALSIDIDTMLDFQYCELILKNGKTLT